MNIIKVSEAHLKACVAIAKKEYRKECESVKELYEEKYEDELYDRLRLLCIDGYGLVCMEEESVCGYLITDRGIKDNELYDITIPIWGYGIDYIDRRKIMSFLFQCFAEKVMRYHNNVQFYIKIYAHDRELLTYFTLCQFGILCTDALRSTSDNICSISKVNCKELSKLDIMNRKEEILRLYRSLVRHLQNSPIFYPGKEFTDELYMDYILDYNTRMFAAFHGEEIIGIMDASMDEGCFILNGDKSFNVGDIYINKEYRGKMVARELLQFVNNKLKDEGVEKLWVEHGTANPNAIGFWDKYFKNFTYTLVRNIQNTTS